ncbi:hypothetical protein SEMRO_1958_G307870.1 [Seminavis robusta]|uniref:Uncharacterized protein n=1 Tax=Seminavis robusta TaxID=568900 RepID=A0A9N8ESA2_9STRA|nr:hypothetical protein SEMRO_1958_G307870.1 [Seminavis robusta]|eukprot:Sro1958_g307870.1 n/a (199) ;mRNA; r:9174-9984
MNNEVQGQGGHGHGRSMPELLAELLSQINVRMLISDNEKRQARAIKTAIEACDDLGPLSDMMYTQFAIMHGNDVELAVGRAQHLQVFREEYGVLDTFQQGIESFQAFLKQQPGHILSLIENPIEHNQVLLVDQVKFDDSILRDDEEWKTFVRLHWYLAAGLEPGPPLYEKRTRNCCRMRRFRPEMWFSRCQHVPKIMG